jgi:hypothetical protein
MEATRRIHPKIPLKPIHRRTRRPRPDNLTQNALTFVPGPTAYTTPLPRDKQLAGDSQIIGTRWLIPDNLNWEPK